MDNLKCEFCNFEFKRKSNLNYHQKTSKSCLSKQGKTNDTFKCEYCEKILSTQNRLNAHLDICKVKSVKNNKDKDFQILNLEKENNYMKSLLKEKDDEIKSLLKEKDNMNCQLIDYKNMLENANNAIVDIAKQPKSTINQTNTNSNNRIRTQNNVQNNFDIDDIQKITNVLENHLTPDVLCKGQKGVAEILKQHLLQTENGEPLYECTDVSRQKFEFVNKNGVVEIDSKASKLITSLNKANIYNKAHSAGQKLWEKEDGSVDHQAQHVHMPKVAEVLEINQDSSKLRSHLASITCR